MKTHIPVLSVSPKRATALRQMKNLSVKFYRIMKMLVDQKVIDWFELVWRLFELYIVAVKTIKKSIDFNKD